ncbi:hypothetical protein PCL_04833 [Purpureocillium lilacinum]|uniref:Serine/arginine repetitive matrix protein 1 n=1 Tax=Purpureocillium lilacinum TaxID=33203 RepID=A0A2U3DWQ4_PURLI|nr:hypothetical protein Purlil1_11362 [Purpureocillium lilacinum]PWI66695.1 hypothetical protein PCL_04833 [Purpureocillium lilacinum]
MDRDRDGRGRRLALLPASRLPQAPTPEASELTGPRFDDGEIIRYGAGESWRPTPRGGDRSPRRTSPRRTRSPIRDRPRSPRPRSPRPRSPGMAGSDSYVPGRYAPRRRSRSGGDRYRRERSRDRDSPRRRERSRSPMRRSPPPRRSPSRRGSPIRDRPYERPRSPRRDWNNDRNQSRDRNRDWDRDRNRDRDRNFDRRDDRRDDRRRSRSPFGRDRRDRSPPGKSTPIAARGGSYRPRSRSPPNRRGDRYDGYRRSSPPRDSGVSSALVSRPTSERASPRPSSTRVRSPLASREETPQPAATSGSASVRDAPGSVPHDSNTPSIKSPPRGPAALRAPPTGPASNRSGNASLASPGPTAAKHPQTPGTIPHRSDTTSPSTSNPPAGPRGYVASGRGGYPSRGGRGGWSQPPSRQGSSLSQPPTPGGPAAIPTGPRGGPGGAAYASGPGQVRPSNPHSRPFAHRGRRQRPSLAQSLLSTMPPIVPGGKLEPSMTPLALGVTRELEPHYRKLRDEEEKLREELKAKQEKVRKSLYLWDRLERESRAWELRSDLSEKSMKNLAGEGMGGAAF